jgi:superfamily II DNA or RNA helicase
MDINYYMQQPDLRDHADALDTLISSMNGEFTDEMASGIKDKIQQDALSYWKVEGGWGMIVAATGVGKSKIAINAIQKEVAMKKDARILICVPTEKLRDENWKQEFKKWKLTKIYTKNVERTCHVSMAKIKDQHYDLVVFDEAHNITEANAEFFKQNEVERCIALTATPPVEKLKKELLRDRELPVVYELPLDMAVKLRLVSPYKVYVVEMDLDDTVRYVKAGSKAKPFMTTEKKQYDYLTQTINRIMFNPVKTVQNETALKFRILERMRFIYNLASKKKAAEFILENLLPAEEKTLIFCGSIEQAKALCRHSFHSDSESDHSFQLFKRGMINRLSCVKSINEGHDINVKLDNALVVQLTSKERNLVQRIGRLIRYRKGHEARIVILTVANTVDEKWAKSALENLDPEKVRFIRLSNLVSGNQNLSF